MGADCDVQLPERVRLRDVADVLAALAGLPMERMAIGDECSWAAHVPGVSYITHDDVPELVYITFSDPGVKETRMISFHYENDAHEPPGRQVSFKSTARNIALAVGLVNFFGGTVDFNDCDDSTKIDYVARIPDIIRASDDPVWTLFQERKMAVKPVTTYDISRYKSVAGYRD